MILNARESGRTKSLFPDRWSLVDRHNGVSASGLCLALGDGPAACGPDAGAPAKMLCGLRRALGACWLY